MQNCITKKRECFFDQDECAGSAGACSGTASTRVVTATGQEEAPVNDVSHPVLASLFCIGPTSSSAVNNVAGIPGLGRLKLKGTARGLP
jgi:hypothetical protein